MPPLAVVGGGEFFLGNARNPLSRSGLLDGIVMEMGLRRNVMKKIVDWINSHKILTVCIAFLLLVVQPFFVHLILKIPAPSPFFVREWNAGDLITYIAGFEAFIGTVFLGVVAVRQNDKANNLSERVLKIEEESGVFSRYPNLVIKRSKTDKSTYRDLVNNEAYLLSYIDDIGKFEDIVENWDRSFFMFTFSLKNLSAFNIKLSVSSLILVGFYDKSLHYNYSKTPINIQPDIAIIAQNCDFEFGIIIEDTPSIKGQIFEGKIDLSISNHLNEDFIYTVRFGCLVKENNSCSFYILGQYDSRLIKQDISDGI